VKAKNKHLSLFLVFLTLLIVSVPSLYSKKSQEGVDIFNLGNSQVSWNVSEYINFTGPPIDTSPPHYLDVFRIFVDDNDPNYNWSKTEAENEWCSGSGIIGDPYIIEGLYINAQGDGGGIYIKNTSKHFVIRDCWVNNSGAKEHDAAVLVRWAENGIIEDNIFTYTIVGVWVQFYSSNISVLRNYMINDPTYHMYSRAVNLDFYCSDIDMSGNIMVNFRNMMYISLNINNLTLRSNYVANFIFEEWNAAPVSFRGVHDSRVIYNILDGVYAKMGVFVSVSGGMNNIVQNNTVVSPDAVDVPFIPILSDSPKLQTLDRSAIDLQDCNNNLIAHNKILSGDSDSDLNIPGYDTLLTLSLAGIVFTALVIKICLKKSKR